ncbi:MAG: CoA transferase [Dehalococcoidales bacterium]|nr:CoA transferase [Dehalococcoidales bacterium]
MEGPLSGVRVVAIENYLAGPVASMTMGDLGAEVIKIETKEGDKSRLTVGPNHKGESNHYLSWNRNKKSIILDLKSDSGRKILYDLVKVSDIVVNNFRPGGMKKLGADHDTLSSINPRIISVNLSGMGPSGPERDTPVVDSVAGGISGLLSVTGEPGGRPVRPGPAVCDITCALYGVIGAVSALYEREKTGKGQNIDVPLVAAGVALMGYHISYYTCSGEIPGPLGSGYPFTAPFGAYKTKDSHIVLGPCWPRIAYAVGAEWLVDDPRFAETENRLSHRQELDIELEKVFQNATTEEWLAVMKVEDIIAGPLNTVDRVVKDPQVNHLDMILDLEHPLGGSVKLAGNPIKMQSIKGTPQAPPTLGQHTDEVQRSVLGYSNEEIQSLNSKS